MGTTCKTCGWIEVEEFGLYCPVLNKRIFAINLEYRDPLCTRAKKKKRELISFKREKKDLRTLRSVHIALGAPHGQAYDVSLRKDKKYRGALSVYRHLDGELKTKDELIKELKDYYHTAIRKVYPDLNPYSQRVHFTRETRILNDAYKRGRDIIERRFKL